MLDSGRLGIAIVSELKKKGLVAGNEPEQQAMLLGWGTALATAIVTEIISNAVVNGGTCADKGPISGGKVQ